MRLRAVVVRYGDVTAVSDVDLEIERGQLTALVGPSGCGKTSLLRLIAGFEHPARGSVWIDGREVAGEGLWIEPHRRHVGMVFQQGALFPHLTVWKNVQFGVRRDRDGEDRARAALELVGLSEVAHRFPDELSGGQQQRVALARALAPSPKLVLLDEPFANLDASLRLRVREEMLAVLRSAGVTTLIVTHDQQEALSIADVVAVMHAGRLLQTGAPPEVYHRPATAEVAEFIGDGQLVHCTVRQGVVNSPLGPLRSDLPDGPARLLVRPEEIELSAREGTSTVPGQFLMRRYLGHEALDEVSLADGQSVRVRRSSLEPVQGGSTLHLRLLRDDYPLYPESGTLAIARR